MASEVDIANIALRRCSAGSVESLSEESEEAAIVSDLWDALLDEVMQSGTWTFATTTEELAQEATAASEEFDYSYALPSDCLQLLTAIDALSDEYEINGDSIVTDLDTFKIKYVQRVTDTSRFSSKFVDAFAYRLAADIVLSLTGKVDRHRDMLNLYNQSLRKAFQLDKSQNRRSSPKKFTKLRDSRS